MCPLTWYGISILMVISFAKDQRYLKLYVVGSPRIELVLPHFRFHLTGGKSLSTVQKTSVMHMALLPTFNEEKFIQ